MHIHPPDSLVSALRRAASLAAVTLTVLLLAAASAFAGTAGIDPQKCGAGATIGYRDFNLAGHTMREEIRHSYGCGNVGWGRLTQIGGSWSGSLALIQTAWNPGGPSQDGVPGTNWTRTVNAAGQQVCAGFQAYTIDSLGHWHYVNWFYAGCYSA